MDDDSDEIRYQECVSCNYKVLHSSYNKHLKTKCHYKKALTHEEYMLKFPKQTLTKKPRANKECEVCGITMLSSSYKKHLTSVIHLEKEQELEALENNTL